LEPHPVEELSEDRGTSAFRSRNFMRGSLSDLRVKVRSGQIERGVTLVVENLDRLSRDEPIKHDRIIQELVSEGIYIGVHNFNMILDEESLGRLDTRVLTVVSQEMANAYSRTLQQRVKAARASKREKVRNDHAAGGAKPTKFTRRCPFWLRPVDAGDGYHFEPIPERVDAVRRIFELAREGRGCIAIIDALQAGGIESSTGRERWHPAAISRLLRNREVLGEWQPEVWETETRRRPEGHAIAGYYPQVVSQEAFDQVADIVTSRRYRRRMTPPSRVNVFAGILTDMDTGRPYHVKLNGYNDNGTYRVLMCRYGRGGTAISYDMLLQALKLHCREIDLSGFAGPVDAGSTVLRDQLADIDRKLERIGARIKREKMDDEAFDALLKTQGELARERGDARRRLDEALLRERNPVRQSVEALRDADTDDPEFYRARLRLAVEKISLRIQELPFSGHTWKVGDVVVYFRGDYMRLFTFIYRKSRGYRDSPLKTYGGFKVEGRELGPWEEILGRLNRQVFFSEQLAQEIEAAGDSFPPDIDADVDVEAWRAWAASNPEEAARLQAESDEETAAGWRE
jgi:DNA invertase Pin-like site-specific DNA recombinase